MIVTALTAAALAVVGGLAYQAAASAPDHLTQARHAGHSSSASPAPSGPAQQSGKGKPRKAANAVPEDSGEGRRVVYALGARRVWLVGDDGKPLRTYKVTPSTVSPKPGSYTVLSPRSELSPGSDGVPVEHVVRFLVAPDGVVFGFSAARDGSMPDPKSTKKTGGIRQSRDDGAAMWDFALPETKVVVVP
ncbi:L,D-transpeptidase [Streptomyces sp. MST-110588]|nr:L,D-transpeptidase [Streptomyces sp. MST-110588]